MLHTNRFLLKSVQWFRPKMFLFGSIQLFRIWQPWLGLFEYLSQWQRHIMLGAVLHCQVINYINCDGSRPHTSYLYSLCQSQRYGNSKKKYFVNEISASQKYLSFIFILILIFTFLFVNALNF